MAKPIDYDMLAAKFGAVEEPDYDALANKFGAIEPRTAAQELGRQAGLTARAGLTGVAGIPLMVGDALNTGVNMVVRGVNQVAGTNIPTLPMASRSAQAVMTRAGLPEPENRTERIVQDVGSALTGVGTVARGATAAANMAPAGANAFRNVMSRMAESPGAQAVGGAASASAAGYAREEGAHPLAQLALGMVAGTVAAPTAALPAVGGRGVAATVGPIVSEAGRGNVVGSLLRDFSTNLPRSMNRLADVREYVPGSTPTTAQAARDSGWAALQNVVRGMDDRQLISERLAANDTARTQFFNRAAGSREANPYIRENIAASRDKMADKLLNEQIWPNRADVSIKPIEDAIEAALQSPRGSGENARRYLLAVKNELAALGAKANDPQYLYDAFRKTLANIRDNKLDTTKPLDSNTKTLISNVMGTVDDVIESGAPGYQQYLYEYAKKSRPLDRLEFLQTLRDRTTSKVSSGPDEAQAFNASFAGTTRTEAFRKSANEAGVTRPQMDIIDRVASDIDRGAFEAGKNVRLPGSDTFKNMTLANLVGRILNKGVNETDLPGWAKPLGVLYKIPEQQVRDLLVKAMLDPALARQLIVQAGPKNSETLARELIRQTQAGTIGAELGLTQPPK